MRNLTANPDRQGWTKLTVRLPDSASECACLASGGGALVSPEAPKDWGSLVLPHRRVGAVSGFLAKDAKDREDREERGLQRASIHAEARRRGGCVGFAQRRRGRRGRREVCASDTPARSARSLRLCVKARSRFATAALSLRSLRPLRLCANPFLLFAIFAVLRVLRVNPKMPATPKGRPWKTTPPQNNPVGANAPMADFATGPFG